MKKYIRMGITALKIVVVVVWVWKGAGGFIDFMVANCFL